MIKEACVTWKPDVCIYHFPCDDGFCSAWIARRKWPDAVLAGTNYGLPFPDVDITGKNVLIADFSYKPDVLREMGAKAKSIVVLDHHKTAAADLADFRVDADFANSMTEHPFDAEKAEKALNLLGTIGRNIVALFDMDHSGAMLTWDFCFPGQPPSSLVKFIEDRDLWRFALPKTRAVSLYLRSFPYDFDVWSEVSYRLDNTLSVMDEAASIERFYDQKLAEMVPTATLKSIGKWKDVPVAHAPYAFASDLAHELLKKFPNAPFAAVAVDAYGSRTYSLRSEDSREDVSEVAKTFGGGGHRNAAGFRVPA
jgi:oligoribonuclease NrnB/cAMP/cGMP phosphodiesterase (DHH superfamily)